MGGLRGDLQHLSVQKVNWSKESSSIFDRDELQMLVSSYYLSPSKLSPEIDYRLSLGALARIIYQEKRIQKIFLFLFYYALLQL